MPGALLAPHPVGLGAEGNPLGSRVVLDEPEQVGGGIGFRAVQAEGDIAGDTLGLEERGESVCSCGGDTLGDEGLCGRGGFGDEEKYLRGRRPSNFVSSLPFWGVVDFLATLVAVGLACVFGVILGSASLGFSLGGHRDFLAYACGRDYFRRDLR